MAHDIAAQYKTHELARAPAALCRPQYDVAGKVIRVRDEAIGQPVQLGIVQIEVKVAQAAHQHGPQQSCGCSRGDNQIAALRCHLFISDDPHLLFKKLPSIE